MQETPKATSIPRRRSQGVPVSIVSGVFVLAGIALRDRVPWYATAFFAGCLVIGVLSMLSILGDPSDDRAQTEHLTIDDVGITRTAPDLREHVAWGDIARVRILTTDQGPWLEDVFFVVDSRNGDGCVVTHDLAVRSGLLEALQSRLEGVNNAAVIEAMCSAEAREFTIWEAKRSERRLTR
jgi:hypothetical protein